MVLAQPKAGDTPRVMAQAEARVFDARKQVMDMPFTSKMGAAGLRLTSPAVARRSCGPCARPV